MPRRIDHRRIDRARRHAIDANALRGVVDGHGAGKRDHRAL